MGDFVDGLKDTLEGSFNNSTTENGALGLRTTGRALLDLNFVAASLRSAGEEEIADCFTRAFFEDRLLAVKWLFFARDVRGGLGERRLFRVCLSMLAQKLPEYVRAVAPLVPEYGRWDDLWRLLDVPAVSEDVIGLVKEQLDEDLRNMAAGASVSLLAKWMPRCKASCPQTRRYARIFRRALNMTERQYQRTLAGLCRYLVVVEQQMSAGKWCEIDYERVPSRANLQYSGAFMRRDEERRTAFLEAVSKGDAAVNASVLFPYDIVHRYPAGRCDDAMEALWNALPDTVQGCGNTIVVADSSGSMCAFIGDTEVTALEVAFSLAVYFAEHSSGQFRERYITFSEHPQLIDLSPGKSLWEKIWLFGSLCGW